VPRGKKERSITLRPGEKRGRGGEEGEAAPKFRESPQSASSKIKKKERKEIHATSYFLDRLEPKKRRGGKGPTPIHECGHERRGGGKGNPAPWFPGE